MPFQVSLNLQNQTVWKGHFDSKWGAAACLFLEYLSSLFIYNKDFSPLSLHYPSGTYVNTNVCIGENRTPANMLFYHGVVTPSSGSKKLLRENS